SSGSSTARRMLPIGGHGMYVLSTCQRSAPSPFGFTWSRTITSGTAVAVVRNAGTLTGPNRSAKRSCSSGSSGWSRKNSTRWSTSAPRSAATVASSSSARRSTPVTSAPIAAVSGATSRVISRSCGDDLVDGVDLAVAGEQHVVVAVAVADELLRLGPARGDVHRASAPAVAGGG